jgi:hypothetical protein
MKSRTCMQVCRMVFLSSLIYLPGCLSTTLYETARVCPPGTAEVTLASTPWFWRTESTRFVLEQWNRPGPELSVRAGLFKNLGAGVRLLPAPGLCVSAKYQFLNGPIDVAATAAGYGYLFAAIDAGARWSGAYGGVLASSERPGSIPFSAQALMHYERAYSGSFFSGSYRAERLATSIGAGVPMRLNIRRNEALRVHPAASVSLPLSWRYWDWSWNDHGQEPPSPPEQREQWRGVVTLDLGIGLSYITAR